MEHKLVHIKILGEEKKFMKIFIKMKKITMSFCASNFIHSFSPAIYLIVKAWDEQRCTYATSTIYLIFFFLFIFFFFFSFHFGVKLKFFESLFLIIMWVVWFILMVTEEFFINSLTHSKVRVITIHNYVKTG